MTWGTILRVLERADAAGIDGAGVAMGAVYELRGRVDVTHTNTRMSSYARGYEDGVRAYSWMRDGTTYVGTTGRTLKQALADITETWNYAP